MPGTKVLLKKEKLIQKHSEESVLRDFTSGSTASITTYSKRWQQPESEENMLKYKILMFVNNDCEYSVTIYYSVNQRKRQLK